MRQFKFGLTVSVVALALIASLVAGCGHSLAAAPSTSSRYVPPAEVFVTGTPAQTYLGAWADGTPLKPAHVENPCASN